MVAVLASIPAGRSLNAVHRPPGLGHTDTHAHAHAHMCTQQTTTNPSTPGFALHALTPTMFPTFVRACATLQGGAGLPLGSNQTLSQACAGKALGSTVLVDGVLTECVATPSQPPRPPFPGPAVAAGQAGGESTTGSSDAAALSAGALAGIAIAIVFVVALAVVALLVVWRRRRGRRVAAPLPPSPSNVPPPPRWGFTGLPEPEAEDGFASLSGDNNGPPPPDDGAAPPSSSMGPSAYSAAPLPNSTAPPDSSAAPPDNNGPAPTDSSITPPTNDTPPPADGAAPPANSTAALPDSLFSPVLTRLVIVRPATDPYLPIPPGFPGQAPPPGLARSPSGGSETGAPGTAIPLNASAAGDCADVATAQSAAGTWEEGLEEHTGVVFGLPRMQHMQRMSAASSREWLQPRQRPECHALL